ncbi:MAG: hypothetical protein KatS3mg023_3915 [Armatimonadota bacterium]|nr:MAG: hypothetical protein KatS3mg023_3915 [Armatimonadota bacterium]
MRSFAERRELHDAFEKYVVRQLQSMGFELDERTYHKHSQASVAKRLRQMHNPTALFLRGKSDFAAIHHSLDLAFHVEIKTTQHREETMIEAIPLMHHVALWRAFRIECIYVVLERSTNRSFGFWVREMPPPSKLVIPSMWEKFWQRDFYDAMAKQMFPNITQKLLRRNPRCGSGTPFFMLDCSTCDHWTILVESRAEVALSI